MPRKPGVKLPKKYMRAWAGLYGPQMELGDSKVLGKPKKPPKPRTCPTEETEHLLAVAWLRKMGVPHHHSPNGGRRSLREGARFKAMGTMAGWPDLEIPVPRRPFHGMFCEVKALDGKVSEAQAECMAMLRANGYYVFVAWGAEQFIELATAYLGDWSPPTGFPS